MAATSRLERAQHTGFPVAGEPLAVDLADTIITVTTPATDLLADETACRLWWDLQQDRLPDAALPPPMGPTVELRQAIREILDAQIAGTPPNDSSVSYVNRVAADVPRTRKLVRVPTGWASDIEYHAPTDQPYQLAVAFVADSLIDFLVGPTSERLRRCENPSCSMLFVAQDARRKFCTQNICANRTRAARHYHRHH
ncbi:MULTISPECIES: CGNR zinc finger domain-containing protein [Mycobacteriaceae]|uniref:Zinc finger CGNR domain-containing protein n=1 Tax=Mycolicibacterium phocaicum TaxID=319706 RepID=A0AA94RE65_9MYCO|nr:MULTISPECIES: ABATE domain-containing protein [Mycolicibacterium]MCX8556471.1 ABATE domain-containing protein [Mycolicibacterium mucogenicum]TLH72849.1 hypothetical protein C1S79_05145 [Mycolicibacterium phocaicum]TXH24494.1 MAG: hypothetical protein E6R06_12160 [Mycobacterium sp.]